MNLEEIQEEVKKMLSPERYYHSVCVMEQCEKLAIIYNIDIETAKKVGISHDIAKEMNAEEKLKYVNRNNLTMDKIEETHTTLLHAKIGADITVKKFGFSEQMRRAIEAHTTGKKDMDMLAKILYIADLTGEDRQFGDRQYLISLLEEDIDKAIIYALGKVIEKQTEAKQEIHIDTILTRNELLRKGGN